MRPHKSKFESAIAAEFPLRLRSLPSNSQLTERRRKAFAYFEQEGLPTRRNEDYHYTDLRALLPAPQLHSMEPMAPAMADPIGAIGRMSENHHRLVKGAFVSKHPLPDGVEIYTLEQVLRDRPDLVDRIGSVLPDTISPVIALNLAFLPDITILIVRENVDVTLPLQSNFVYGAGMPLRMEGRIVVIVEDGARVTMINSVSGSDATPYQVNGVIELMIGDGAKVDYLRSNQAGATNISLHTIGARLGKASELNLFCFNAGAALTRTEVRVTFAGEGAKAGVRGVSLLRGSQHCDVTLMVDHQAPSCESRELFRYIVDESAMGVFQGKIMVKKEAQKTDGQMASNAILLSDDAVMNNKPELEIFADDVVCAHGATAGALDDDLLFYLQARGLPRADAEALMIQAFCGEAIEFVANERIRDALNQSVSQWLAARAGE